MKNKKHKGALKHRESKAQNSSNAVALHLLPFLCGAIQAQKNHYYSRVNWLGYLLFIVVMLQTFFAPVVEAKNSERKHSSGSQVSLDNPLINPTLFSSKISKLPCEEKEAFSDTLFSCYDEVDFEDIKELIDVNQPKGSKINPSKESKYFIELLQILQESSSFFDAILRFIMENGAIKGIEITSLRKIREFLKADSDVLVYYAYSAHENKLYVPYSKALEKIPKSAQLRLLRHELWHALNTVIIPNGEPFDRNSPAEIESLKTAIAKGDERVEEFRQLLDKSFLTSREKRKLAVYRRAVVGYYTKPFFSHYTLAEFEQFKESLKQRSGPDTQIVGHKLTIDFPGRGNNLDVKISEMSKYKDGIKIGFIDTSDYKAFISDMKTRADFAKGYLSIEASYDLVKIASEEDAMIMEISKLGAGEIIDKFFPEWKGYHTQRILKFMAQQQQLVLKSASF